MHNQGLYLRGVRRKYRKSSLAISHPNMINQDFTAKEVNQIWFGDIPYIPTHEGNLYCSVFIDYFSRKIVGYSIKDHMRESIVIDSLISAIQRENPKPGSIIHTDHGSQYTGYRFYEAIKENRCINSHSRKGNPNDNAVMESFYKSFKQEVFPKRQYKTKSLALFDILDYLENYYNKRFHSSLGYQTPYEFSLLTKSA